MCGIFCYCGKTYSYEELYTNFILTKHRGPDDTHVPTILPDSDIWFGFHRLSINGQNVESNQPLIKSKIHLICNGEIYNHQDLEEMYDLDTVSKSDCEVIISMYLKFGIAETLRQIRGEFSFVLADLRDSDNHKLYAARDPFGRRQMYYSHNDDGFLVASEAKSIMMLGGMDVKHFLPGTYYSVLDKVSTRYYTVGQKPDPISKEVSDIINSTTLSVPNKVYHLYKRACHMYVKMSDLPVASFGSGGFDSISATALAIEVKPNTVMYTIGLKESQDIEAAVLAAKFLKVTHVIEYFTVEDGIKSLPELIWCLETCDGTTIRASLPMWMLAKKIPEKAILSGEGADETFSGYMENFNAPTPTALHTHALDRIKDLYKYDLLRGDKSCAASSHEIRMPCLDRDLVDFVLNLDPKLRDPKYCGNVEKSLFRESMKHDPHVMPEEIRVRPKEAFSDGVGYSWVDGIKDHAEKTVSDDLFAKRHEMFPENTPLTKETFMYRQIYYDLFEKHCGLLVKKQWLPKWCDHGGDPSARVTDAHKARVTTNV
jgi:asparagine synthase (glutamine-hydrolysing)